MLQHVGTSAAPQLPVRVGDQDPSQPQHGHAAGHILTCGSSPEGLGCLSRHLLCFSSK